MSFLTTIPKRQPRFAVPLTIIMGMSGVLWLTASGVAPVVGDESDQAQPSKSPTPTTKMPFDVRTNVAYVPGAGRLQQADLYIPNRPLPAGESRPGLIMIHGGAWAGGSKAQVTWHARRFARHGYMVMAVNYRLAPIHQHPAQIDDCRTALQWLVDHADEFRLDPERVGVFGYSAGGHLACLLAAQPDDAKLSADSESHAAVRIKVAVAGGAPCDFRHVPPDQRLLNYWLGGNRADIPEVYYAASPITSASPDDPPTLFFHGDDDNIVPLRNARMMHQRLVTENVETQFFTVHNKGHLRAFTDLAALRAAIAFCDKHLNWGGPE